MKKQLKYLLAFIFIVMLIAALYELYVWDRNRQSDLRYQYQAQIALHQATIDSLNAAFAESQTKVDTLYIELTRWRTRYDTIYMEIPTLPPTEQLALFDQYTAPAVATPPLEGAGGRSFLLADTTALVPMPRIERALILFTERDQYAGELTILEKVIEEKDGQISTLRHTSQQQDRIIQVQDDQLSHQQDVIEQCAKKRKREAYLRWVLIVAAAAAAVF